MKTIIARFEDMKKDPTKILEDGISANKVEDALASIGVALRDTVGEFRPLQDVFLDLGMKWDSLTRNQQAYIATVAAGSRQQSRFLSIFNNFERTLELITESQNSAGAAAKQYAIYQDSIAAAQARLTASWENFYSKIIDNDAIKFVINSLASLVDALSHIPPVVTAVGAAFGALQIQKIIKNFNNVTSFIGDIANDYGAFALYANDTNTSFKELLNLTPRLSDTLKKGLGGIKNDIKDVGSGFIGAGRAVASFVATNWQFVAVAALVTAAIVAANWALNRQKKAYEDNIKSIKSYKEEADKLTDKTNNADTLIERYDELSKKVNRTTEEQQELNNVIQEISSIYSEAIDWVDEYGNHHLENVEILKEEIQLEKDLAKEKNRTALEQRLGVLNTDSKNWQKEDFEAIGFSNAQVSRYFNNRDKLDFYNNINTGWYSQSILGGAKADAEAFEMTGMDSYRIRSIKNINNLIKQQKLDFDELNESTAEYADINNRIQQISDYWNSLPERIEKVKTEQEELVQSMRNQTTTELSFLDLMYNPKAGTATAQKAIAAKLKTFVSGLSNDAYNEFVKNLPEKDLALFVQNVIDKIGVENYDTAKEVFDKLLDPNKSAEDLQEIYTALGELLGNNFMDGFEAALQAEADAMRKTAIETFNSVFPNNNIDLNGKETEQINRLSEIGKQYSEYGITDLEAERLEPYLAQIEEIASKALEEGSIEGVEEGINSVVNSANLYGSWQKDLVDIGNKLIGDTTKNVMTKIMSEAMEAAEKELSESQENFSTASSIFDKDTKEGLSDKDLEFLHQQMENADAFIKINEEGEKYLTLLGKIVLIEKEQEDYANAINEKIKQNNNLIESIEKSNDKVSDSQQKQIDNYRQENRLLEEQRDKLQDIQNTTIRARAITDNISYADTYYEAIKAIKNAAEEAEKANGRIKYSTFDTLRSLGKEYSQYLNERLDGEDTYYELTAENAENMKKIARNKYEENVEIAKAELDNQITALKAELQYFQAVADGKDKVRVDEYNAEVEKLNNLLVNNKEAQDDIITKYEEAGKSVVETSATDAEKWANNWITAAQQVAAAGVAAHQALIDGSAYTGPDSAGGFDNKGASGNKTSSAKEVDTQRKEQLAQRKLQQQQQQKEKIVRDNAKKLMEEKAKVLKEEHNITQEDAKNQVNRINAAIDALEAAKLELKTLAPDLEDISKTGASGADEAEKMAKAIQKAIDNASDAVENLNKLLKETIRNLKDISIDYNPFTDLFEAWEHEWDYYYNIKRLIQQIEVQGKYIDNVISSDYTSAQDKVDAYHAKIGNITAAISANDAYITALRAGMTQTGVELMQDFGDYYKINPETGQIYQTDKNLQDINSAINQARQELYDLQKLQNEKENNLSLENAKLEALEEEKSAYEDILSEIDSQLESLSNDDDIIADVSGLEAEKTKVQASLDISDNSIDAAKDKIREMEDEIQEIEVQITLKQSEVSQMENYVDKMEDKVSEYEQYWETLNETIAGQQERLQELAEIQKTYIDTAISTQQALYDAIVENYQDEINEKKSQYDQLKQLDNDYLQSVRDSINKERQLREDSNKQRSYQANIQRAQLLQMDTSGAFRSELATLNKEIKNQRQDLYDDLVDKQVEALQKEIENRHELYDKEVAALEERLAFMQENAILLWEKVNSVVAQGSEAMMSLLMGTTEYINSSELEKQQQRDTWEQEVKTTVDGVNNGVLGILEGLIKAGNSYITDTYPEVQGALEDYTEVFKDASDKLDKQNEIVAQQNLNAEAYNAALEAYYAALDSGEDALTAYNAALEAAGRVLGTTAEEAGRKLGLALVDGEDSISKKLSINMQTMAENLGVGMDDATEILNNKLSGIASKFDTNIDDISANLTKDFTSLGQTFLDVGGQYAGLNTSLMNADTEVFGQVLTSFQELWNSGANKYTGYAESWETTVTSLKEATEENIKSLKELNKQYEGDISREMNKIPGSIGSFIDQVEKTSKDMYDDFLAERTKYRDELEKVISEIGSKISAAISSAASAITGAASSVRAVPDSTPAPSNTYTPTNNTSTNTDKVPTQTSGNIGGNEPKYYVGYVSYYDTKGNAHENGIEIIRNTSSEVAEDLKKRVSTLQNLGNIVVGTSGPYPKYLQGGLANFTGLAWLDGSKSAPERVLSPRQTKLFESMVSSLEKTANNSTINSGFNSSYNIGEINTVIKVDKLDNQTDINELAKQVENKIVRDIRNKVSVSINKGV